MKRVKNANVILLYFLTIYYNMYAKNDYMSVCLFMVWLPKPLFSWWCWETYSIQIAKKGNPNVYSDELSLLGKLIHRFHFEFPVGGLLIYFPLFPPQEGIFVNVDHVLGYMQPSVSLPTSAVEWLSCLVSGHIVAECWTVLGPPWYFGHMVPCHGF